MVATTLKRGQLAIIQFNMEDSDDPSTPAVDQMNRDSISFVLLAPIGAGTVIYFTDRTWNGTVFSTSGTDGTYTFTAGADMAAGTVITISTAELNAAGINLLDTGEAIYAYQGTTANTPNNFLFAIEGGDGNNTFNATLTNTGLTAGVDAVGIGADNASFAGRTWNIQTPTLYTNIGAATNWVTNENSPQFPDEEGTNLFTAPDRQIWVAGSGGGNAIQIVNTDGTHSSNLLGYAIAHLYQNTSVDGNPTTQRFFHPTDVVLDTVNDRFFIVDSDGTVDRILQGSISQALNNPGVAPTMTVLYRELPETSDGSGITGIAIDTTNQDIYFTRNNDLMRVDYNTANQAGIVLADLGNDTDSGNPNFANEIALDIANGRAYIVSTETFSDFVESPPGSGIFIVATVQSRNSIFMVESLAPGDINATGNTVTELIFPEAFDEDNGPFGGDSNDFDNVFGKIISVDVNTVNGEIWFTAVQLNGGQAGEVGGIYRATRSGPNLTVTVVYSETNATNFNFQYIDVDEETGRYYVTSLEPNEANDHSLFSGLLTDAGVAPTFVAHLGNINALGPLGLTVQSAPTLAGTGLTPGVTEASSAPLSGETTQVALYSGLTAADIDPPTGDELSGAQVRISVNFQSGATHQDFLRINGNTSGTVAGSGITYTYNSATGVMTLSGPATVAEYAAALQLVTFSTSGDDVTAYGAAPSRTTAASVFDGLLYSDEITAAITVTGINDAPVNTIQGAALGISEDALNAVLSTTGNAISVFDVDADPATQNVVVTLSVTQGTLTILTNVVGGIVAGDITGGANGTNTITITATQNEINATLAAANGLLYNPIADYNGSDTLTIVTNDGGFNGNDPGNSGTGTTEQDSDTRTINIAAVVDIANDPVTVGEDSGTTTIDVLGNDSFENPGRIITLVTQGLHGTVVIVDGPDADGFPDYLTYTPIADYNGSDSFTYTVTSGGVTETATVNVTVTPVVDIANDTLPLTEDDPTATVDVLGNDSFENAARFISGVTQGLHGVVTIVDGPTTPGVMDYVTYTAVADYNGSDSFTYTVTSGGVTETATVNVTISAVADIMNDVVTVDEDSGTTSLNGVGNISLLANDSFENAGRAITSVTQGVNGGTVAINTNGTPLDATDDFVTYTPALNYNGPDSFTYTVTSGGVTETATVNVTVNARNDAPVNTVGAPVIISEDATNVPLTGMSIADVDVDPANDPITVILEVDHGVLNISETVLNGLTAANITDNGTGSVTIIATLNQINATFANATGVLYTPTANYNGSDTLTLTTNDGGFTGADGALEDSDDRAITINAVNDTPAVTAAATGSSTEQVAGTVDATAAIADADLDALNGGSGNYAGATLNIANNGGNDANDLFAIGTSGAFTVNGSNLEAGGLVFATFSGGNGTPLIVSFTSSGTAATTALVNAVVQSIQYTYTGDNPPVAGIDVAISLNDGAPANAGQGSIAGHPAAGTDIIHLSITNTPENQPPVVDLNGTDGGIDFASAYTEDGTAAVIADTDVTITDADVGDDITGATITVTDAIAGDQLTVVGPLPGSIIAAGGGTATVTLSGTGTQAEYQQALTQIRYSSTSNDPTVGGTDLTRSVTVTVTDGDDPSGAATTTVTVTGTNDAPAGTDNTITVDEDGSIALNAANFDFTDPDSGDVMSAVIITSVTGGKLFFDADGAGGADPVEVTAFPTAEYSVADMAAGKLTFEPNANLNGSGAGSIGFQVVDNSGAVNDTDPSANTLTVNVTPINDSPVVPNSPAVTTDEQVAVTLNPAITISDVDLDARNGGLGDYGGATFIANQGAPLPEDVYSFDTTGALFTVSSNNLQSGGLTFATFSMSGGVINILFNSAQTTATTALVNDVLQHLQYTNTSEEPPASVQILYILDDGAPGSGGQGALGAPFNNLDGGQVTVNINSINDAPSGTSTTITINEDTGRVMTAADFGFSDTAENDGFAGVVLTTLPTAGILVYDSDGPGGLPGVFAAQGQFVTAAELALGALTYFPGSNGNGDDYATFTFQVRDDGGTANGGQNTDQSANTITFDVTSRNDAPSGTNNTVTGSEDDPYVFTLADFGYSDPADLDDFAGVIFTTVPTTGTLFYDADGPGGGAPVALADGAGPIAAADIAAGKLYFVPVTDAFGSPYASFTFQVQDDGGTANSGQNTDQSANTMTINIAPDNLPPAVDLDGGTGGVNYTASFTEDGAAVAIGSGVTVTDPNSGTGDMIESAVITLTDRVTGDSLTLTGVLPPGFISVTNFAAGSITMTITGAGTGAQYQALIESIQYATTNQDPTVGGTDPSRTITVTVNDGLVDSAVATTTVNITALDDAAEAEADAYTITEQGTIVAGNVFADNGAGADSDPDGPPLAVSAVNGSSGNVGMQITLASGARLTVNANGTFDYNPNGAFDPTPVPGTGASNTPESDQFSYTLAGGGTATVTITITGIDTNDDIEGTAGADTLFADGGTDRLIGFGGNDSYYVNSAGDLVLEAASEGNDIVYANVSYALAAGSSVETLSTIALAATDPINLTGNEFGNTLFGNAGANVLIGGGGADFLTGFAGNDEYHVDTAADVVIEQSGEGQDVVYASTSYALAMGSSIEILSTAALGATDAINLTGNELGNILYGNAGDNVLIGGGGADYMVGFGGDDAYYVDNAGDVTVESAGGGRDVVYASMNFALAAGASIEVLSTTWLAGTDAINLTGNGFANLILGNAGVNVLNGGGGADYMAGFGGDDEYHVDNAGDFVAEEAGGGRDAVYASANYTLTAGSAVEVLSTVALGATTAINLTGNELGNEVYGNGGSNVLNGGGGADYLNGFGGADSFAFTTALGGGNVDFVADFTGIGTDGDDVILLDDAVFTGLALGSLDPNAFVVGTAALDADDRIIYDADTGALYFDADGSGAGVAVQFATLDGLPALTAGDFTVI